MKLLLLMIGASIVELFSFGMIFPFLAIISSQNNIFTNKYLSSTVNYFDVPSDFLNIYICIIFLSSIFLASYLKIFQLKKITYYSFDVGSYLGRMLFNKVLKLDYVKHKNYNSSQFIDLITNKPGIIIKSILIPCLTALSGVIVIILLGGFLFVINPIPVALLILLFLFIYFVISRYARIKLEAFGKTSSTYSHLLIRHVNEGLSSIRDVIIDGMHDIVSKKYALDEKILRDAQCKSTYITTAPRILVEGLFLVIMATLATILSYQKGGLVDQIPFIGVLAFAAQRILPLIQQIYNCWTGLKNNQLVLEEVNAILDTSVDEIPSNNILPVTFNNHLILKDVSYAHGNEKIVFDKINLSIKKGQVVGIIGKSGAGKSTLLDLMMGLLSPSSGLVLIDGVPLSKERLASWWSQLSHVPQHVYLVDGSFEQNIAFRHLHQKIDQKAVVKASQMACLQGVIEGKSGQYKEKLGELGSLISGGQMQRVGIARALYKKSEIIFLDEATSALDFETEDVILKNIKKSGKTIILITHRKKTLTMCDVVYKIHEDGVVENMTSK